MHASALPGTRFESGSGWKRVADERRPAPLLTERHGDGNRNRNGADQRGEPRAAVRGLDPI